MELKTIKEVSYIIKYEINKIVSNYYHGLIKERGCFKILCYISSIKINMLIYPKLFSNVKV
jgi:hypothetical protein